MKFLLLTIFCAIITTSLAVVCPKAATNPTSADGCYNSGTYICQCATGVQIVCAGQLGLTSTWRKGASVYTACKNGTPPAKYTAIATFLGTASDPYNGSVRHAAIFISCGTNGAINVIDQYTGKKWGPSVISDRGTVTTSSYNSQLYYVIV